MVLAALERIVIWEPGGLHAGVAMILGDEAMCICSFLQHRPEKPPLDCSTRYAGETRTLSNYVFLYDGRYSVWRSSVMHGGVGVSGLWCAR